MFVTFHFVSPLILWKTFSQERPQRGLPLIFWHTFPHSLLHRHSTPAMCRHSSTAAAAPSRAAFPTAPTVPFIRPKTTDAVTISVHDVLAPEDVDVPRAAAEKAGGLVLAQDQGRALGDDFYRVQRAPASTPLSLTTVTEARPLFAGYPVAGSMMCQ